MVRSSVFFKNMFDLTIMTRLKLSDEIKLIWRKAMKLLIVNMKCGGCARGVTAIIHDIDSNAKIDMDLAAKVVNIDTIASVDQMMAALARDDFPAQVQ